MSRCRLVHYEVFQVLDRPPICVTGRQSPLVLSTHRQVEQPPCYEVGDGPASFLFQGEAVRGSDNVGADFLSRAPVDVERDSFDRRGDR